MPMSGKRARAEHSSRVCLASASAWASSSVFFLLVVNTISGGAAGAGDGDGLDLAAAVCTCTVETKT